MLKRFLSMILKGHLPVLHCHKTYGWFADVNGQEIRYQWRTSWQLLDQGLPPWADAFDDEIPF